MVIPASGIFVWAAPGQSLPMPAALAFDWLVVTDLSHTNRPCRPVVLREWLRSASA
jgi:hypothetical protein